MTNTALLLQIERDGVQLIGIDGGGHQRGDDLKLAVADLDHVDVGNRIIGGLQLLDG